MGKRLIFSAILLLLLVAGCGPTTTPPPTEVAPAPTEEAAALELVGLDGTVRSLTMSEIQALPATAGWGGFMSSVGDIIPPSEIRGVALTDLCELVGGLDTGSAVRVVAEDGYAMTLSYEQVVNGDYIAYDPGSGGETADAGPLVTVLAYERDGQPLPADDEGALRLAIIGDNNLQVTDGHWWVKWVNRIEIISMAQEWGLHLEGATVEDMDRNTFESCSSPSCHQSSWTDDEGQVWTGTPLWLLTARVDDETPHGDGAFNRDLAAAGYTLDVVAADGFSASFDIQAIQENNEIVLAFLVNDSPLPEDIYPLRVVGPDLTGRDMVSQVTQIVVHLPEAAAEPSPEATEAPAGEAALTVNGAVAQPTSWTMAELEAMEVVEVTADHPSRGTQTNRGVRLNALLDLVQPNADATTAVITAVDGFSAEIALADIRACTDCIIAFTNDGTLKTVMPGFTDGSAWVKDVVQIELR